MLYIFNKEKLKYVKVTWKVFWIIVILTIVISTMSVLIFWGSMHDKPNVYTEKEVMLIMSKYNEFSADKLKNEIKKRNFKFPHIIYAQAILETGNFKSIVFKENNNLFGMKQAKQRVNIAVETQLNHAYYDNWRESLEDYGYYYCSYLNKIETEEEYFNYLSQSYAESPNYVERLKKIIDSLNLKKEFN